MEHFLYSFGSAALAFLAGSWITWRICYGQTRTSRRNVRVYPGAFLEGVNWPEELEYLNWPRHQCPRYAYAPDNPAEAALKICFTCTNYTANYPFLGRFAAFKAEEIASGLRGKR